MQFYNNEFSSTSYGNLERLNGDVVGLRYNADTGKLGFIINGVDQGDVVTTLSTSQRWAVGVSLGEVVPKRNKLRTKTLQVPTTRWFQYTE